VARRFPWVLAAVSWSDQTQFTRGTWRGKPLLSHGIADRTVLATRRQLRAMGKRPGGQDPCAFLYFRCRKAGKLVFANLYLIALAKPVRPMTPAKAAALGKAMAARRTCRGCGECGWKDLPKTDRLCEPCQIEVYALDPDSYLHDFLGGEPTVGADHYYPACALAA